MNDVESSARHGGRDVAGMFDRIAHRYDLLNRLLSLGRDTAWRRRLAACLADRRGQRVLDLATGTADVLLDTCRDAQVLRLGAGLDPAGRMLDRGREKIARRRLEDRLVLVRGDATHIPFGADCFDAVTVAFGMRNIADVPGAFCEACRVLRAAGRLVVLEFSIPTHWAVRPAYLLYFRHVLPHVGAFLSGHGSAYRYLNQSVESFPCGQALCEAITAAGFTNVHAQTLTFGIATLYQGEKAGPTGSGDQREPL